MLRLYTFSAEGVGLIPDWVKSHVLHDATKKKKNYKVNAIKTVKLITFKLVISITNDVLLKLSKFNSKLKSVFSFSLLEFMSSILSVITMECMSLA